MRCREGGSRQATSGQSASCIEAKPTHPQNPVPISESTVDGPRMRGICANKLNRVPRFRESESPLSRSRQV
jgi:hypothetical protein